jgi:glutamate racemase
MARIGIFDSGVGGLTVQRALLEALPGADTIYLGDTARVPYGTKSAATVTAYSLRNARVLFDRGIDLLVVACNTASAVALPALRGAPVPVWVVEPGARAAAAASRGGRVGVIGTPGTVASGAYQAALRAARPGLEVSSLACPLFVPLAEEGWTDPADEVVRGVVRRYLAPLRASGIDTLVLGCTHYPLLTAAIAAELPGVVLVDSAASLAAEVAGRVGAPAGREGTHRFFVTDAPARFLAVAGRFLGRPVLGAERRRSRRRSPGWQGRRVLQSRPAMADEEDGCGSTTTSSTRVRSTISRPKTLVPTPRTSSRTSSWAGTSSRRARPPTPTSATRRTSRTSSAS